MRKLKCCYTPSEVTVDVGGVVTMTNTDSTGIHTFTSGTVDGFTPSPDGTFDSQCTNVQEIHLNGFQKVQVNFLTTACSIHCKAQL